METSYRPLRITLLALFAMNLAFAYLFLLDPASLSRMYGEVVLDNMHLFLSMGFGSLMVALGIGAFLAFLNPVKNAAIVLLLIIAYFSLFLTDVIVAARVQMPLRALLPEMVFYLVVATLLIRFFPTQSRIRKEEKKEDPILETETDPLEAVVEPEAIESSEESKT